MGRKIGCKVIYEKLKMQRKVGNERVAWGCNGKDGGMKRKKGKDGWGYASWR